MADFKDKFITNFISEDRWKYILDGLGVTLQVTFFAVLMGIVLGLLIAIVRSTHDKTGKLKVLNAICQLYLTIIRGTPVVVQLLIIYFVIFGSVDISKVVVAVLAFGINSGAYVAEIFRSGIMSIDKGQFEAASALGMSHGQTMRKIVLPQVIRNILPATGNEFVINIKDTSVLNVISITELFFQGNTVAQQNYQYFQTFTIIAAIYFVLTFTVTRILRLVEKKLDSENYTTGANQMQLPLEKKVVEIGGEK